MRCAAQLRQALWAAGAAVLTTAEADGTGCLTCQGLWATHHRGVLQGEARQRTHAPQSAREEPSGCRQQLDRHICQVQTPQLWARQHHELLVGVRGQTDGGQAVALTGAAGAVLDQPRLEVAEVEAAAVWHADVGCGCNCRLGPVHPDQRRVPESLLHWDMLQNLHQDMLREGVPTAHWRITRETQPAWHLNSSTRDPAGSVGTTGGSAVLLEPHDSTGGIGSACQPSTESAHT